MPEIRKFLTVSASHLPRTLAETLLRDPLQPTKGMILGGYHGIFVFARGDHPDYPESVQRLLAHAATDLDCSFVLFDGDGDLLDGFPTYSDECAS
jgi:hypothetical protein